MSLYCHKNTKLSCHCLNDLCNTLESVRKVRRSCCCNTSEKLQPSPRRCKKVGAHQSSARRTSGIQRHFNSRRQGTKCVWTKHNREAHVPRTKWHDNASLPSFKIVARPCSKRFRRELAISQNLHDEARTFLFRAEALRERRDGARMRSSMKRFTISRRVLSTLSLLGPYACFAPERPLEPPHLKNHCSGRPLSTDPQSVRFPNCH